MADFVIIGGGIYGCTVAWELARRGADVHLLEAKTIASGASGGLGKRGVRANGRDLRELPFMRLAYEQWETLHEQIDGETGYERLGHLLLIEREADYASAAAHAWLQEQQGIPTRLIAADELHEIEPYLSEQVIAALYCPQDGVADHTQTTKSMAKAAQKHGAIIQENTIVTGLERQGNKVTAVLAQTKNAEIRIPVHKHVFLLSNSHALKFIQEQFGITLPVWSMLPQVIRTATVNPVPVKHLIGHANRTLAIKPLANNEVMISGGWHGRQNPETGQAETVPEQVEGNRAEAVAVYPILADVPIIEAAADRSEVLSADGIPIIDTLSAAENMIIAVGWSGHGWAIAPAVGKVMAEWALSNSKPSLLKPFCYKRFART
ncbi:MAG: FAD-binding oxidoreductase [Anaerolineae bacterium]|nr:FAD-binding oxidoreductase [Anaerolineae bacterium]